MGENPNPHNPQPSATWSDGERASVAEKLEALAKLCVTRSGSAALEAHIEALAPYLEPFPASVVLAALDRWPSTEAGKWFPTAHELLDICRMLAAQHRAKAAASQAMEGKAGRFLAPTERSANAVRRIRAADEKFARAWLQLGVNVQFGPDAIYTTGIGYDRISQRFEAILDEEGVKLIDCPQVSYLLAQHVARLQDDKPAEKPASIRPRRVRYPLQPETLEERRAVVAALRAAGLAKEARA